MKLVILTVFCIGFFGTSYFVSGLKCYLCAGCDTFEVSDTWELKECEYPGIPLCVTEEHAGDDGVTRRCGNESEAMKELNGPKIGCHMQSRVTYCFCREDGCNNKIINSTTSGGATNTHSTGFLRFTYIPSFLLAISRSKF